VTVTQIIQIEANDSDQRNDLTLGMWESLKLIEIVKKITLFFGKWTTKNTE